MNDALRDKIARAIRENRMVKFTASDGYPSVGFATDEELADAVLAVLDLDRVRAVAWDEGFDAGQAWESDMNSRVIPSADRQDNPYRKADQ